MRKIPHTFLCIRVRSDGSLGTVYTRLRGMDFEDHHTVYQSWDQVIPLMVHCDQVVITTRG